MLSLPPVFSQPRGEGSVRVLSSLFGSRFFAGPSGTISLCIWLSGKWSTFDVLLGELHFVFSLFRNLEISMHIINIAKKTITLKERNFLNFFKNIIV